MKKTIRIFLILIILFVSINNVYAQDFENVLSKNIILINLNEDKVIYEKNADEKVNIASLTKIMTLLVSVENIKNFDEEILVTENMLSDLEDDLSVAGFYAGETLTYNDLLYGVILKSGADATHILALKLAGSEEGFAKMMNDKAREIGMTNSSFANSYGIEQTGHYSSARDISKLLKYALKNEKFKEVYTTKSYTTKNNNHEMDGPLKYLTEKDKMNMSYVKGAKTGFTEIAGVCLSSISTYNNVDYMLITIGADYTDRKQAMKDSKVIYEYYFNNYGYNQILKKGDTIIKGETIYEVPYKVISTNTIEKYIKNITNKEDLKYKFKGDKTLGKNVKKGDEIGTFYIEYNDEILYEEKIISPVTVKITARYFVKHNKVLLCTLCILIVLLSLVIINRKRIIKER